MSTFKIEQIAQFHPTVHTNTNYVTIRDVVDAILACGGAAIGSDAPEEAEEITSLADGLLINIGTPSERKMQAMLISGQTANQKGIPVVLDPVGVGASAFRRSFVRDLLTKVQVTCIRGNYSELLTIDKLLEDPEQDQVRADQEGAREIVSDGVEDALSAKSIADREKEIRKNLIRLSSRLNCLLAVTGETDLVVDHGKVLEITGGSSELKIITGSGCMLSGLVTAALSAVHMAARQDAADISSWEGTSKTAEQSQGATSASAPETENTEVSLTRERKASCDIPQGQLVVAEVLTAYKRAAGIAAGNGESQVGTGSFRTRLMDQISAWPTFQ